VWCPASFIVAAHTSGSRGAHLERAGRWVAWGGSLPSLAGPSRRVLAQHIFGIKKLLFKFSDLLLITNLFELKMSLNLD
jgi:hypothetical protein